MTPISRRDFCRLLWGTSMATVIGFSWKRFGLESLPVDNVLSAWHHLLPRDPGAQVIGRAYLARYPQEASAAVLVGKLAARLAHQEPISRAELAAIIRQDFADGQMAILQDWVVSLTEARLCALATLI